MDLLDRLRLDHPILQAGMGGGVATPRLAGAVATAGGLGTLGLLPAGRLRSAIGEVRERAPGRAVAVNLLMPFAGAAHVEACTAGRVDAVVLFFGCPPPAVARLRAAGVFTIAQIGSSDEARDALAAGVDALIAQGREAGGHLRGRTPAHDLLGDVLAFAGSRPVLVAGGIATADDVRAALDGGAAAAVAGTRFLLTEESAAHPLYKQRLLAATDTVETTLFGFGWPARHRVVPNAATERWCRRDGRPRVAASLANSLSWPLSRLTPGDTLMERVAARLTTSQRPGLPVFTPSPPTERMPDHVIDSAPLYAGTSVSRLDTVVSAAEAVRLLAPVRGA